MEQEVKEESKEPVTATEVPEQGADAPTATVADEATTPEPSGESPPPDQEQQEDVVTLSKEEYERLQKDAQLKEDYQRDLLALKGSKRAKELFEGAAPDSTDDGVSFQQTSTAEPASFYVSDYVSKREDLAHEYRDAIAGLDDATYSTVKEQMAIEEDRIKREIERKKAPVARGRIKEMFDNAIEFAKFKHKPKTAPATTPHAQPTADLGMNKTTRKFQSKPQISDRARAIQPFTRDPSTGELMPLERIQEKIDRGEL